MYKHLELGKSCCNKKQSPKYSLLKKKRFSLVDGGSLPQIVYSGIRVLLPGSLSNAFPDTELCTSVIYVISLKFFWPKKASLNFKGTGMCNHIIYVEEWTVLVSSTYIFIKEMWFPRKKAVKEFGVSILFFNYSLLECWKI